ncbi:MAG: S8 family serine peptidase [Bacteroidetes bacterium]|nr:S8 family serine peptidase [Bacteroidota bacterium]MCW5894578.1 S8 family serine peptidase [Bacteroidota bacterium]
MSFPEPVDVIQTLQALNELPEVEYAEPPIQIVHDLTPNDLHLNGNQWYLPKIQAEQAWDVTTGSASIRIALIERGVAPHDDLYGKLAAGEGGYSGDHGVKVAGVAGAATNNSFGVASLGWNSLLVPMNSANGTDIASDTRNAADPNLEHRANVINCSFKTVWVNANNTYYSYNYSSMQAAVEDAQAWGRLVVASAGNGPQDANDLDVVPYTQWPAAYAGVLAVSATNSADQFPSGYNYGNHVDVSGPAIDIRTLNLSNGYASVNGTSFSAPLTSAIAALIWSVNPSLTATDVANAITSQADDLGPAGWDDHYGHGRINAFKSVRQTFQSQTLTISSYQPTPGGVLFNTNTLGGTVSYIGNKSSSSGGPFYSHGSFPSAPVWMSMADIDIQTGLPYVNTTPYYWTVHGWNSTAGTTAPSAVSGPVAAFHLKSTSPSATGNNNQQKIARAYPGQQRHFMVFESGGDIYLSKSTNGGSTWLPELLVSQGNGQYANPSIEDIYYSFFEGPTHESYIVWEENPVGANGYRIWSRRRNNLNDTWGPITLLHENLTSRPAAALPTISGYYVFWRSPSGILWTHVQDYFHTAYSVPGTDANSNSPSVDLHVFTSGTAHLTWEQTGSGIRYSRGTVDQNGTNSWTQVYSIADNSGLTTNARPTVVGNYSGDACIAWNYKFITNGSVKFRTVAQNGTMSSVTTFPNPPGTTRIPTGASLSHYRLTFSNDLTLSWQSPADGVIALYYRNGNWQSPFVVAPSAQHAHVSRTWSLYDGERLAQFMGTQGSLYDIYAMSLPSTTPAPRSPLLLTPTNGATGVPVPATFTWDYVIGASTYRLQIDDNSDFSSPVVDVSGLTATNHYASLNTSTTYYWRLNATSPYGTSAWSTVWSFTTGDPLPPSCPFVFTWNGDEFVEDNNILPQSLELENSGIDVLDVYRLMKPPVASDGKYLLQIREDAEDYSRFDNFTLVAVDHPTPITVTMKDDGTVIPYIKPFNLHRARHRDRDVVRELISFDSLVVNTSPGDMVDFGFKRFSGGSGLQPEFGDPITNSDSPMGDDEEGGIEGGGSGEEEETDAIGRPLLFSSNGGQGSISQILGAYFRHNPSLVYIPFTVFDTTNVQLMWSSSVKLDYLNLAVKVPVRVTTRELRPEKAMHSLAGDVTEQLVSVDSRYAELARGQALDLTFAAPHVAGGMKRTFFLITTGRYEHLQASPGNQLSKLTSSPSFAGVPTDYKLHQNHPNPFNPTTVIRYDLPIDGHATLKVYDVLGREALTLLDGNRLAGFHQAVFDARGLSSGTYFYRLQAGDYVSVKKLLLLR